MKHGALHDILYVQDLIFTEHELHMNYDFLLSIATWVQAVLRGGRILLDKRKERAYDIMSLKAHHIKSSQV